MITPHDFQVLVHETLREVDAHTHPDPSIADRLIANAREGEPNVVPCRGRGVWIAPLIAAAAAVVAALALAHSSSSPQRPPATRVPSPPISATPTQPPSPSPSPAVSHIERRASLSWFGMKAVPGYTMHMRDSKVGYQWLALRLKADTDEPIGCNGCESASDYVYVFDSGKYDAAKIGNSAWRPVRVGGQHAYLGTTAEYGNPRFQVPTVAWQYRPNSWALVQGVTAAGGSRTSLLTVANAVRPTESVPIELPVRFDYLPDLPIVDVFDDRSEGFAFGMTFGAGGRTFDISLWNGTAWTYYNPAGMTRQTIGGLPGFYGPQQGAGVLYHGGGLSLSFGDATGEPLTTTDQSQTQHVLAGLHWANGNGAPPLIPAEQAIPRAVTTPPAITTPSAPRRTVLASPDTTLSPAKGCIKDLDPTVTIVVDPDTPAPGCVIVGRTQRLRVLNNTNGFRQPGKTITIQFAGLTARVVDRGRSTTYEKPFGTYLARGEHFLRVSYFPGTDIVIWLK